MATIRDVVKGLEILMKYCDPDDHNIQAEHDEIFAPGCEVEKMDTRDMVMLDELGWVYDAGLECWKKYT